MWDQTLFPVLLPTPNAEVSRPSPWGPKSSLVFCPTRQKKKKSSLSGRTENQAGLRSSGTGSGNPCMCTVFLMWPDDRWRERRGWEQKKVHGGAEHRPHWRGQKKKRKKSLVSLVSITRLKRQMGSQWGSLSGSHYWNRTGFFFLHTHKSFLEAARFRGLLRFPSFTEWFQCVCIHTVTHTRLSSRSREGRSPENREALKLHGNMASGATFSSNMFSSKMASGRATLRCSLSSNTDAENWRLMSLKCTTETYRASTFTGYFSGYTGYTGINGEEGEKQTNIKLVSEPENCFPVSSAP